MIKIRSLPLIPPTTYNTEPEINPIKTPEKPTKVDLCDEKITLTVKLEPVWDHLGRLLKINFLHDKDIIYSHKFSFMDTFQTADTEKIWLVPYGGIFDPNLELNDIEQTFLIYRTNQRHGKNYCIQNLKNTEFVDGKNIMNLQQVIESGMIHYKIYTSVFAEKKEKGSLFINLTLEQK